MKNIFISLIILLSVTLFANNTQAQSKVGHFDLQYVLPQIPEYKKAEAEMETYAKQIQDELKSKQEEFERKLKDYQGKMEAGTLTPAMQASKEKELQTLQQQFQRFQQGIQQDGQSQEARLMAPIYEKIQKALDEVAKEGGYGFILRDEACYASPKAENISDRVLRKMGFTPKN
jgi:outer membrane protein